MAREVPPRKFVRTIVALDLGSERSWSDRRGVLFKSGRSECYAVCPGIPDLESREKQDAMPRGMYKRLYEDGVLIIDEGRRVSRPKTLVDHLVSAGIEIDSIYCDRFVLGELTDAVAGRWPILPRVTRWSEASSDIAGFHQLVKDGPLSITPESRALARLGMSQAKVVSDDQGSVRLQKSKGTDAHATMLPLPVKGGAMKDHRGGEKLYHLAPLFSINVRC